MDHAHGEVGEDGPRDTGHERAGDRAGADQRAWRNRSKTVSRHGTQPSTDHAIRCRGCGNRAPTESYLYYLLKDQGKARTEIEKIFAGVKSGKMSIPEFIQRAQQLTEQLTSF